MNPQFRGLPHQMLDEDFGANADQHQTTSQLGPGFEPGAEKAAYLNADCGQDKRGCRNNGSGFKNVDLQEGKRDPHSQRVNAGGNGQRQHGQRLERGVGTGIRRPGFFDHFAADEDQQNKYDPMVKIADQIAEPGTDKISDQRHGALEYAKPQSGIHGLCGGPLLVLLLYGQAFAYGHSEGIHGEADCDKQ